MIVKAADVISAPGRARKDSLEFYVKRLEELEAAASSFPGVEKSTPSRPGREIRVFVNPTQMDDLTAEKTARDIAQKIEAELKHRRNPRHFDPRKRVVSTRGKWQWRAKGA